MEKHTFKHGDRVFGQVCTNDVKIPGVFIKRGGVVGDGCLVRRDDGVSGIEPGLYWFAEYLTTHDTNFQVGDWVRYEKMDEAGTEAWNGKIGVITFVDDCENYPCASVDGIASRLLQANLVKIQPPQIIIKNCVSYNNKPQEAHVETVKIKHGKYGVVEGVNVLQGGLDHGFTKDGAHYFCSNGWSQVPEVEWVTIQVEKGDWERVDSDGGVFMARTTRRYHFGVKWRYPQ